MQAGSGGWECWFLAGFVLLLLFYPALLVGIHHINILTMSSLIRLEVSFHHKGNSKFSHPDGEDQPPKWFLVHFYLGVLFPVSFLL